MRCFTRRDRLAAATMLALVPAIGFAQGDSTRATMHGRVIDARTTRPLPSVVVIMTAGSDTIGRAQTDTGGAFVVSARTAPRPVLHFVLAGYRTDSLATDATVGASPLRVAMTSTSSGTVATLGPTKVVASNGTTDFDRRAARHVGGVFITEADIAKRQPVRTSDLFKTILGVSVRDSGGVLQLVSNRGLRASLSGTATTPGTGGRGVANVKGAPPVGRGVPSQFVFDDSSRGPAVDGRKCVLRVGLDGQLMDPSFSVDEVPVGSIRGIEAYVGTATIPIEFSSVQPDAPCGIVMIWTRTQGPRAP
ncbi:MAG TPA: hypothetical protein VGQ44_23310 [Gemmatimonadaceae bacterium]|jgi:hypothetical protein|nr:hypothetical protein [Gemmatimonadaceae bacterium]